MAVQQPVFNENNGHHSPETIYLHHKKHILRQRAQRLNTQELQASGKENVPMY